MAVEAVRAIPGTERLPLARAVQGPAVDPETRIRVTIYVRPRRAEAPPVSLHEIAHRPADWRKTTHGQTLADFDADAKDLRAVQKFATSHHLKVIEASRVKRSVLVEGRAADLMRAFAVDLHIWNHPGGRYRGRTGPVHVPANLSGVVESVFGLDNRRIGRPFFRKNPRRLVARAAHASAFLPGDLVKLYAFPPGTDGSGQTVAILSFNGAIGETGQTALGGYDRAMVNGYFKKSLKLGPPNLKDVVVHGPGNSPGDGSQQTDATGEVLLDICTAAGVAPKASFLMYFTEFTEQGWVDGITSIVTASPAPSIVSISYGNPEDGPAGEILWTKQAIMKVNEAFQRAAQAGISIFVASGDQGSTEELNDHRQHVDFPASSPWVTACGGTRVAAAAGVITSETVWNDGPDSATGGGVSKLFPVPPYQAGAHVPPSVNPGHKIGRGVPDVSSLADPQTGLMVVNPDGTVNPVGGTSAAAPLWAGLTACLNQSLGKPVGFLNPLLYQHVPAGTLRDITAGDNGAYVAGPGWDPCTGFGSPNGARLVSALKTLLP